jgi:cysteinyl-tRNA synthetase
MNLRLYDTLTREKRLFEPLERNNVRMYVCGPTVYDFAHIGNARPVIVFDVLFRLLRHLYGESHVKYVRNITDVDDKINARAAERLAARGEVNADLNAEIRVVTEETYRNFREDIRALGVLMPEDVNILGKPPRFMEPRATEFISRNDTSTDMIRMIGRLVANGHAYFVEGHVLFDVPSLPSYGRLSRRLLDELLAGARIDVAPYKRNSMDFVLWKPSRPGEPAWPSPWGWGRPGWHIECSAMAAALLGERFDIHGGGVDLVFPHHENELAQTCCAFNTDVMANFWMHNGFLQVEGEKMSKSVGNFFTIRELLEKWPGDVLRLQMLMTHYRRPIDWTESTATLAAMELEDWSRVLQHRYHLPNDKKPSSVVEALSDDLNTPNAVTALRDLFSRAKRGGLNEELEFASACKFLGFRELNRPGLFESGVSAINVDQGISKYSETVRKLRAGIANNISEVERTELLSFIRKDGLDANIAPNGKITLVRGDRQAVERKVNQLIADRTAARASKDFEKSDAIRGELEKMGVVLKDGKDADGKPVTTWEIAR